MNERARPTTRHERDRALDRLQAITAGTAIAATIASAGFGTLAAFTWAGDDTDASSSGAAGADGGAAGAAVSLGDDTPIGGGSLLDQSSDIDASPVATAAPLQPTTTPLTATTRKSRVSSGGSR